jgi:hypothetical protein
VNSPRERLKISINILTMPVKVDQEVSHVNDILLSEIIFSESLKAYHTKNVDKENNKGYFEAYKSVVQRVSEIVLEVDPNFEFPHMLISTVIEGAHHQKYFSDHLPSLTDSFKGKNVITDFYQQLVFNFLK